MKTFNQIQTETNLIKDIEAHLKTRGVNLNKTRVILDKESNLAYFFIYSLSGKLIGYQRYNPNGSKFNHKNDPNNLYQRYYTYITKESNKAAAVVAYGLETYNIHSPFIFITEGIFDQQKIANQNYPAIALLKNDPDTSSIQWLKTLPQKKIVILDNDKAGSKLKNVPNSICFTVPLPYKDLGDMPQSEVNYFLETILTKLKLI